MELHSILLFGGVMILVMLTVVNMRRRRGQGPKVSARDKLDQMDQVTGMKKEMAAMMVELEELTRQFGAQLDSKSTRLEKLLDEAEQRIHTLRGMMHQEAPEYPQQASRESNPYHSPASSNPGQSPVTRTVVNPPLENSSYDQGYTSVAEQEIQAQRASEQLSPDPKKQRIFELSRQGKSALQIARELDEQVGKVELILALGE